MLSILLKIEHQYYKNKNRTPVEKINKKFTLKNIFIFLKTKLHKF
jgi:hypothetical protein